MARVAASQKFQSILWPDVAAGTADDDVGEPACFHDLNLDQLVTAIATAWPQENLPPFFRSPAQNHEVIQYRQAALSDLSQVPMRHGIDDFIQRMRSVRAAIARAGKLHYAHEKQRALLGAAGDYCDAVRTLANHLQERHPTSPGFGALGAWLADYIASGAFEQLTTDAEVCIAGLAAIRYNLLLHDTTITVAAYADEDDASVSIEATFAKFRRDTAAMAHIPSQRERFGTLGLNHIEAQIVDKVALLNPEAFDALGSFCQDHAQFVDGTVARFAREVCFYLAWLAYTDPLRDAGLRFCLPQITTAPGDIRCEDGFDVALAVTLVEAKQTVVTNDFALDGPERVLVVSGPNHGGKTTFARMFGQLHWLGALGLDIPGSRARLLLFDRVLTHFGSEEDIATQRGRLQDDLVRLHTILAQATPRSLIIMNELFASTTLADAVWLGKRVLARIRRLGSLAAFVTFLTELADFDDATVSMVAAIDPDDPATRTFKLERRPANGLAYAIAVARKHRVTRAALLQRIAP